MQLIDFKIGLLALALCCGCEPASDWREVGGIDRDIDFYGIWGTGADDIYAVGGATGEGAVILHFDGDGWKRLDAPEQSIGLRDVWASPSGELYVVGRGGLFRRDGEGWIREIESDLEGIHGASEDIVVAVGAAEVWQHDGAGWTRDDDAEHDLGISEIALVDVWCASDSFAVATGGVLECSCQANMAMHFTGNSWSAHYANVDVFLKGVWGAAVDDVYAVGGDIWDDTGSVIVHFDGHEWSLVGGGREDILSGVWGSAANDVYAVGMKGDIQHFDGAKWSLSPSGTSANLRDVWGADADRVYAVGADGVILRRK